MQCASVRNKTSTDRCSLKALMGHTLCGKHARAKSCQLWADVHRQRLSRLPKVQALYRGWRVRTVLALSGPGVLRRGNCVNDEELVTLESKDRQYPYEYFGIEEGGRIWWFDFATAWEWFTRSVTPTNPYTKTPISHEALGRLRKLHLWRRRWRILVPPPPRDLKENIIRRWTVLSQIFRGYGFEDAHPEQFANLSSANLKIALRFLSEDIDAMPRPNKRMLGIIDRGLGYVASSTTSMIYSLNLLTIMMTDSRSYDFVFLLLSALYRC